VKDLIARLSRFDPDLEVLCSTEDETLVGPTGLVRFLDIQDMSVVNGVPGRDENRVFTFSTGSSDGARPVLFIDVTAVF
jgi:hypothetical protein